jgi:hypothetical protein
VVVTNIKWRVDGCKFKKGQLKLKVLKLAKPSLQRVLRNIIKILLKIAFEVVQIVPALQFLLDFAHD